MTICQFFLQGRCRFGDRCWNEHPGTRGAGGGRQQQQQQQQQPSGNSRRGWNATSERYSTIIQPSSFAKSSPWGGSRDQEKSFGFFDSGASSNRNRGFGSSHNPFGSHNADEQKDEKKLLEGIAKDMEIWESSGQWMFSVYSPINAKPNISGFTDISPEELRFEYHKLLISNDLQTYLNSIQQLISQWKDRIKELKSRNISTKAALFSSTKDGGSQSALSFGFGSRQTAAFGSQGFTTNKSSSNNIQNFSFKTSPVSSGNSSIFGSTPAFGAVPSASSAITASTSPFGFGKAGTTSASSFSFKNPAISSSGSSGFSGFPASTVTGHAGAPPAFRTNSSVTGFGSLASHSHTSRSSSDASSHRMSNGGTTRGSLLFTSKDKLTAEELEQFQAKKFTLYKIPIKPPPVELLNI